MVRRDKFFFSYPYSYYVAASSCELFAFVVAAVAAAAVEAGVAVDAVESSSLPFYPPANDIWH